MNLRGQQGYAMAVLLVTLSVMAIMLTMAMPVWKHLSDTELAAVMTYTRNNWGNKTGEVIQPSDFVNARAGKFREGGGAPGASGDAAPKTEDKPAAKQASAAGDRAAG